MSDKDLDKLFKNKLEDLNKNPRQQAWEKISAEISENKTPVIWWRIAAAVLLLFTAGTLIYYSPVLFDQQNTITQVKDSLDIQPETQKPVESEVIIPEQADNSALEGSQQESTKESEALKEVPVKKVPNKNVAIESQKDAGGVKNSGSTGIQPITPREEIIPQIKETEPLIATVEVQQPAIDGQTISYNISEFTNAEIQEEDVVNNVELSGEKSKGKLWKLIEQVKEPENGLGELRDFKNELFAFGKGKKETE